MCSDTHTQEWIRLWTAKVEKENPVLPQPSTCCEPKTKRLDTFIPSVLSGPAVGWWCSTLQCQRQTAHPWCGMQREKTSHRAVSSAKTIPVLLLAWGCARRHRPQPAFCTFCFFCSFSSFFPPGSYPFPSHKHTQPWFRNEMWRVFAGTEGAGVGSWEEIWKLPFAKYL